MKKPKISKVGARFQAPEEKKEKRKYNKIKKYEAEKEEEKIESRGLWVNEKSC